MSVLMTVERKRRGGVERGEEKGGKAGERMERTRQDVMGLMLINAPCCRGCGRWRGGGL